MSPAFVSHGPPPTLKHRKFAGNGPATSSEKSTRTGTLPSLTNAAPAASWMAAAGFERSIVVCARRPSCVPIEHEFGPSEIHSESFGNRYWPCAQMPYWPPCWRVATPLQLAQDGAWVHVRRLTMGEMPSVLFV